jgi:myo-inositol-1(or 4)-monophosphatase
VRPEAELLLAGLDAAQRVLDQRVGAPRITSKGGRDLVTDIDIAIEDAIRAEMTRLGDWPVVGEERGGIPPERDRPYWLLDPICGTRVFACGLPLYCTNLALVEGDRVTLAGVREGDHGPIRIAEAGGGSFVRGDDGLIEIRASDANPVIWVDPSSSSVGPWTAHATRFASAAMLSDRWYVWMIGSTLPYAFLADGRISAVVHFGVNDPLHTAAGCLLVSESGAKLTDLDGRDWSLNSGGYLGAATAALHRELLEIVQATK